MKQLQRASTTNDTTDIPNCDEQSGSGLRPTARGETSQLSGAIPNRSQLRNMTHVESETRRRVRSNGSNPACSPRHNDSLLISADLRSISKTSPQCIAPG